MEKITNVSTCTAHLIVANLSKFKDSMILRQFISHDFSQIPNGEY
jgi:hypothetical protein